MDNNTENTIKKIELRSEKVRNIIGEVPPFLIRSGIGVIAMVVILATVVCCFIPIYDTTEGKVKLLTDPSTSIVNASKAGIFYKSPSIETQIRISAKDTIGYIQTNEKLIMWYISEVDGEILLNFHSGDNVRPGDRIFAIVPDSSQIYGQLILPYEHKAKIKKGQDVMIELEGFPAQKYGVVMARVYRIYPLKVYNYSTKKAGLKIDVILPDGTRTSYKKDIRVSPEMAGKAKIILSKQSVFSKIL